MRLKCLWKALVWNEAFGVWGGMSEYERRCFRTHVREEGYTKEMPQGMELQASLAQFYSTWTGEPVTAIQVVLVAPVVRNIVS